MSKLQELHQKRAQLVAEARQLTDRAETETRSLTSEESANFDKYMAEVATIKRELDELTADVARRNQILEAENEQRTIDKRFIAPDIKGGDDKRSADVIHAEHARAFETFVRGGHRAIGDFERRALQMDSDEAGGYIVAPQAFTNQLIQAVDNMVLVRQLATKIPVNNAHSIGAPSLDADPADPDWTSEIETGTADSSMDFGKREMRPWPLAKQIKVSNKLIRNASNIVSLVAQRMAYKFAITEESAFMSGNGASRPLGLFTASNNGISTSRDVSTGNDSTSIKVDGLKAAKYTLKQQYRNGASTRWIFHRDGVAQIAKLKDGEGNYLWQNSIALGEPDRLLNIPVLESEYAPNTFTSGLYVGLLGDLSFYWIADGLGMTLQRLDELYAATNQVGFIGRMELDAAPVLGEAFVRVKLG